MTSDASIADLDIIRQITYAVQLSVGIVFLAAVIPKVHHPRAFVRNVGAYRLLPEPLTVPVALCVVAMESFLTLTLLTSWMVRVALPLAALLLTAFSIAIAMNLHRGRRIRCGCFGGESERISTRSLVRLALLLVAVVLVEFMAPPHLTIGSLAREGVSALPHLVQVGSVAIFFILAGSWLLSLPELAFSLRHLRRPYPARDIALNGQR